MTSFSRIGVVFVAACAVVLGALSVWPVESLDTLIRVHNGVTIACSALMIGAVFVGVGVLGEHLERKWAPVEVHAVRKRRSS
jgi:hypothetical protein